MLSRPALDRDLHRALVDAGIAPLNEYVGRYDMSERVPATADPVGVPQYVLNAFLDCPGSLEDSLLAAVRAQNAALVAENERLRQSLNEVVTNGMWAAVSSLYDANGEPILDWVIATEVYEMACDALEPPT